MTRRWTFSPVALVAALLVVVVSLSARRAAAQPAPDSFADHFHAEDQTFVVIEDPLPHLKQLLHSPLIRQALAHGPLADLAKDLVGNDAADPLDAWAWLRENSRWIPQQVAVGISEGGVSDIDHLFRLIALTELIRSASTGDADVHPIFRDELKALRRAALAELKQLRLPRLRVYVKFRAPEDALSLLDLVRQEIKEIDPMDLPDSVKIESLDRTVTVRLTLADQFDNDDEVNEVLRKLRLADPDDADVTQQMINVVKAIKAEASLKVVGTGLLLTLGPADGGGAAGLPARIATLPPETGRVDRDTILWGRWDGRRIKDVARGWTALHEQWVKSASYGQIAASRRDPDTALDVMRAVAIYADRLPDVGAARLWADRLDDTLRIAIFGDRVAAAEDLGKSAVGRFIPADAEGYAADMTRGLGDFLSDTLARVEGPGQMTARALLPRTHIVDAPQRDDVLDAGYFTKFTTLRDLIHKTAKDRFERGFVAVLGTQGKIERLEASFDLNGQSSRVSARNISTMELALVGRPKAPADDDAMKKYVEDAYAAMGLGLHNAAVTAQQVGRPAAGARPKVVAVDLGLGVPTWGFEAAGLQQVTGEAKVRIAITGDLQPHFVVVDGCLVISTSARLTKSLLAAQSGKSPRMVLPRGEDRTIVAAGRLPGETLAKAAQYAGDGYLTFLDHIDRAGRGPIEPEKRELAADLFGGMAQAFRLIDRVEWQTAQTAGAPPVHVTHGTIHFVDEKK